jgi:hypothetical protein
MYVAGRHGILIFSPKLVTGMNYIWARLIVHPFTYDWVNGKPLLEP